MGGGGPDGFFAVYLFSGIVLFNALQEGASRALTSVIGGANLVRKVVFPCELLPLTPVLVALAVYVAACVVMVILGLALGHVHLGLHTLLWPVLLLLLLVFCMGLGLFLATAQVFARDVSHVWGVLSLAWFFLSPNFWRVPLVQRVADKHDMPWLVDLLVLNPAYSLLMAQRQVFGIGNSIPAVAVAVPEGQEPAATYSEIFPLTLGENLLVCAIWAILAFFIGFGFFMSRKHKFADLI